MFRLFKVVASVVLLLFVAEFSQLDAQTLGNPGRAATGPAAARYPHLIQSAEPTYYRRASATEVDSQGSAPDTIIPAYDVGRPCLPLIPTLAQGVRDTLNCLFPCRDGSPLGLGLGQAPGRGLFSVRFHGNLGCGHIAPGCGCGESIIYEGVLPQSPTPVPPLGPSVDPPKPTPDPSAYYFPGTFPAPSVPAAYRAAHQARPELIQTQFQRPLGGTGLPHNPLR